MGGKCETDLKESMASAGDDRSALKRPSGTPEDSDAIFPFSEPVCMGELMDESVVDVPDSLDGAPDAAADYEFSESDSQLNFAFISDNLNQPDDTIIIDDDGPDVINSYLPHTLKQEREDYHESLSNDQPWSSHQTYELPSVIGNLYDDTATAKPPADEIEQFLPKTDGDKQQSNSALESDRQKDNKLDQSGSSDCMLDETQNFPLTVLGLVDIENMSFSENNFLFSSVSNEPTLMSSPIGFQRISRNANVTDIWPSAPTPLDLISRSGATTIATSTPAVDTSSVSSEASPQITATSPASSVETSTKTNLKMDDLLSSSYNKSTSSAQKAPPRKYDGLIQQYKSRQANSSNNTSRHSDEVKQEISPYIVRVKSKSQVVTTKKRVPSQTELKPSTESKNVLETSTALTPATDVTVPATLNDSTASTSTTTALPTALPSTLYNIANILKDERSEAPNGVLASRETRSKISPAKFDVEEVYETKFDMIKCRPRLATKPKEEQNRPVAEIKPKVREASETKSQPGKRRKQDTSASKKVKAAEEAKPAPPEAGRQTADMLFDQLLKETELRTKDKVNKIKPDELKASTKPENNERKRKSDRSSEETEIKRHKVRTPSPQASEKNWKRRERSTSKKDLPSMKREEYLARKNSLFSPKDSFTIRKDVRERKSSSYTDKDKNSSFSGNYTDNSSNYEDSTSTGSYKDNTTTNNSSYKDSAHNNKYSSYNDGGEGRKTSGQSKRRDSGSRRDLGSVRKDNGLVGSYMHNNQGDYERSREVRKHYHETNGSSSYSPREGDPLRLSPPKVASASRDYYFNLEPNRVYTQKR